MLLKNTKKKAIEALDPEEGVHLLPQAPDDMWHLNNLIHTGDRVRSHAVRKVSLAKGDALDIGPAGAGKAGSVRVHTQLTLRVTNTSFDPDPKVNKIRVSGVVAEENDVVALGQHHSLELSLDQQVTIWKQEGWDLVSLQMLRAAINEDKDGAVAAVVMQEGLAHICLITDHRTVMLQRVEQPIPRKRSASSDQDAAMTRYYAKVLATMLRNVDFASAPRTLLVASPGFVAHEFVDYIKKEGVRTGDVVMKRIPKDAVVLHASSGHMHALNEVAKSPQTQKFLKGKGYEEQARYMDNFYDRMRKDDGRAWYGLKPVTKAVEEGAVGRGGGILLINHDLFQIMDVEQRRMYGRLVEKVKQDGGEWKVLSKDHDSGERLAALGGIAAMLTYPMFDLDDDTSEDEQAAGAAAPEGGGII